MTSRQLVLMACGECGEEAHRILQIRRGQDVVGFVFQCSVCFQETEIRPSSVLVMEVDPESTGSITTKAMFDMGKKR